jgi:hypothetical protein
MRVEAGCLIRRVVSESVNEVGPPFNREHGRFYTVSSISELLESAGFQILEVLGQPLVGDIARNEARLVRRNRVTHAFYRYLDFGVAFTAPASAVTRCCKYR